MHIQELLDKTIVNQFPLPIAHEYHELLKISPTNWVALATQLNLVFEFALRYCTIIILSQYYVERYNDNPVPNEIDLFIAKNIANPTTKVCIDILRQISKSYLRPHLAFMPEVIAFSVTPDGGVADGLFLATDLNSFVDQLNSTPVANEYRYKTLYETNFAKVKQFLQNLSFLQNYTLVRLVSPGAKTNSWLVNFLTGSNLNFDESAPIEITTYFASEELKPNRLAVYSGESKKLLHLSRYTIFTHCPTCFDEKRPITNRFFVYERTLAQKDIYVGLEDSHGQPHRVPLDMVIEDLWKSKQISEVEIAQNLLTVRERMHIRTRDQIYSLREKYDATLFVPRREIQAEIRKFFASNKTGFLIVGDSGVGKTNLLCDLAATTLESGSIVSFESCSAFDSQVVNEGFDRFLCKRYAFNLDYGFLGTLENLNANLTEKIPFVLFLDAINEFEDPTSLLDSLYTWLLVPSEDLTWFKIIVSCRSESWTRLKGGFKGERHFWEKEETVVHHLARFSASELPEAYKVYQEKYQIQSSFNELSTQAISFITLPLMLRLVAESNFGSKIPSSLKTYDVFQRYIELKMNTHDQVTATDENLIVNQLVKKMYETRRDRLALAPLFADPDIGQLVMEQKPGRPWINLIDKGVLMMAGGINDTHYVRFAYDQILEFQIARLLMPQEASVDTLQDLTQEVFDGPIPYASLWGALKLKLLSRLDEFAQFKDDVLMINLASVDDINIQAMLIDVLVTAAEENKTRYLQTVAFCKSLLDTNTQGTGPLAIEIAHRLSASQVLERGMFSTERHIWQMATQYMFFLWQSDFESGTRSFYLVRDKMRQQLSLKGFSKIPIRRLKGEGIIVGLQAYLNLALLSVSLAYRYPEAARVVGNSMVEWLNSLPNTVIKVLDFILKVNKSGQKFLIEVLDNGSIMQLRSHRPFFQRPLTDKRRHQCFEATRFINPEKGSLQGELGDILFDLMHEAEGWVLLICSIVLMTRIDKHFESLYQFCKRAYSEGNHHCKYVVLRLFPVATYMELGGPYCRQEHIDFSNRVAFDFFNGEPTIVYKWQENVDSQIVLKRGPLADFVNCLMIECATKQSGVLDLVTRALSVPWSQSEEKRSVAIIEELYTSVLRGVATTKFNILPILESLSIWVKKENLAQMEKQALIRTLSGIRSFFPADVDNYLSQSPRWLKVSVLNEFHLEPLGNVFASGFAVGQPWLIRSVPKLQQAFSEELGWISLHVTNPVDFEKAGIELGNKIVNIDMMKQFALALAEARQ